jgi:MinD-like ATPase involved in chromosome partitioning or flagellar assembly
MKTMSAQALPVNEIKSRLVLTQGGKGGTGKTSFITGLVDWYDEHHIPYTLIDLDTEASKSRGSLIHYFPAKAVKVDIHRPEGLDRLINVLQDGPPVVVADMGAGAGQAAYAWFDSMYEGARELGVAFTAIGLVTPDPATVDSVLKWADALQDRTDYLIVKNAISYPSDFGFWDDAAPAEKFRKAFKPSVIEMEYRMPTVEGPSRNHGLTIGRVAGRKHEVAELNQYATVIRAQAYRRHMYAELDRVQELLLP